MSYVMVDVETDGEVPGDSSMVALGAVFVRPGLADTFRGLLSPVSSHWSDEALRVSGHTRQETLLFPQPEVTMREFEEWLLAHNSGKRVMFVSDNNGFDFMFVCWYSWHFLGRCCFGHSSTNLGSLYKGLVKDTTKNFKHLRRTPHTHDPLDDARGNAEALLTKRDELGLNIILE